MTYTTIRPLLHPDIIQDIDQVNGRVQFLELKSNNHAGAKKQLYCSIPFVDYLLSLLKIHREEDIPGFERHFVIFSSARRLRKQATSRKLKIEDYKGIRIKLAGDPPRINIGKIL